MNLRDERKILRAAARELAIASGAEPSISNLEVLAERNKEREIRAAAVAETVLSILRSVDLVENGYHKKAPGWVLVDMIDRLTVEGHRKPRKEKK